MADIKELAHKLLQLGYTKDNLYGDGGSLSEMSPVTADSDRMRRLASVIGERRITADSLKFRGRNSFWQGGPVSIIHPKAVVEGVRRLVPKGVLVGAADAARRVGVGSPTGKPVDKVEFDEDPGTTFLLDYDRQMGEMEKLGFFLGKTGDYGLVNAAVEDLAGRTGKTDIPVYQLNEDDAHRDDLYPVYNGTTRDAILYELISDQDKIISKHAGSFPYVIYKDKNKAKYYLKTYDLNDYGGGRGGRTYESRQFLADLYDIVGNPFVQTSGIVELPKLEGKKLLTPAEDAYKYYNKKNMITEIDKDKFYYNDYVNRIGKDRYETLIQYTPFADNVNKYGDGGTVPDSTKVDTLRVLALAKRINETSNADFVRRLPDENRRVIKNHPGFDKYACGGLLRKYQDGGHSDSTEVLPEVVVTPYGNYVNYTGEETTVPSISDFFEAKANAARVKAIGNMLNTEHPVVPAVPNALARNLLVRFGVSDEKAAGLLGYDKHPHTCIATTTSQYNDPEAFVPGNITFDKNRAGFVQVGDYDYSPGDLVNLYYTGIPFHSTMVTGVTKSPLGSEYGSPMLTYSNGGIDVPEEETHMRYNMNNLYDDGDDETPDFEVMPGNVGDTQYRVFRYVGSPSRKIDWGREYNSKYGYAVDEKGNAVEPRDKMYALLARMQQYGYKFEKTSDGKLRVVRK